MKLRSVFSPVTPSQALRAVRVGQRDLAAGRITQREFKALLWAAESIVDEPINPDVRLH